jgi:hypothetical protein
MAVIPSNALVMWASSDVTLPNLASANKVKPIDDLILKGWDFQQKPAADEFNYVLESPKLSKFEKIKFDDILLGQGNKSNYESSLKFLSKLLYNYHGVKPIILIDEYDQALITAHTNGYFKEAMNFYRNFLSAGLKDNENFERAILTGILRVAKESIFSGLNNLYVDSILTNKFNYFGLSEGEVLEALKYYERDYEIKEVKED